MVGSEKSQTVKNKTKKKATKNMPKKNKKMNNNLNCDKNRLAAVGPTLGRLEFNETYSKTMMECKTKTLQIKCNRCPRCSEDVHMSACLRNVGIMPEHTLQDPPLLKALATPMSQSDVNALLTHSIFYFFCFFVCWLVFLYNLWVYS